MRFQTETSTDTITTGLETAFTKIPPNVYIQYTIMIRPMTENCKDIFFGYMTENFKTLLLALHKKEGSALGRPSHFVLLSGISDRRVNCDGPAGVVLAGAEGLADIPELEIVAAVDLIDLGLHPLSVDIDGVAAGLRRLAGGGRAGQLGTRQLIGLAGGGGDRLLLPVIAYAELLAGAVEHGGKVADLEIVAVPDLVDRGVPLHAVHRQLVVGGAGRHRFRREGSGDHGQRHSHSQRRRQKFFLHAIIPPFYFGNYKKNLEIRTSWNLVRPYAC